MCVLCRLTRLQVATGNKVVMNWDAITTIYSKDHATGVGARTAGESVQQDTTELEESPDVVPQKRQRIADAMLCMMGDMRTTFGDALKTFQTFYAKDYSYN